MDRWRHRSHDSARDVQDITEQLASTSLSGNLSQDSKNAAEEDELLFDPRNLSEEERSQEFQTFFNTCAPSKVKRSQGIDRIRVLSCDYESEGLGDREALQTSWEKLQQSMNTINLAAITELARRHGCMGGNWCSFYDTGDQVDRAWKKIARGTVAGKLGTHAKVSPCQDKEGGESLYKGDHAISVYTGDFTDKEAVMQMEGALRSLGITKQMKFKPRVHSCIGVNTGNQWGLRPSLYSSRWDEWKGESSIYEFKSDKPFLYSKKNDKEHMLLFDPRIYTKDQISEELQRFFDTSAPSKVKRSEGIGTIKVLSCDYGSKGLADIGALQTSWKRLKESKKTINSEAIMELAKRHGCMGGFWRFSYDTGDPVDRAWKKIARATVEGKLGTHAKVSPCQDQEGGESLYKGDHVISVYTGYFTDKEAVMRLEEALRSLGITKQMTFKARVYSHIDVYSDNQWGLRPSIYSSRWDEWKGESSIYEFK